MPTKDWLKFIRKNLGTIALYISLILCIGIGSFALVRYLNLTLNFIHPLIIASCAFTAGLVIYFQIVKSHKKEQRIQALIQRVFNISSFSGHETNESSQDEYITPDYSEYPSITPQLTEDPNDLPQTSFFDYVRGLDRFQLFTLFKIFTTILKTFPSIENLFSNENKINYVMNMRTLPIEEQFSLFEHLLAQNPEDEILEQLVTLMQELKANETDGFLTTVLQKLEDIVDLAYPIGKRELIRDVLLLMILIMSA